MAYHDLQEIDQYALHILKELNTKVLKAYDDYEFHTVFHSLHHFCVVDMRRLLSRYHQKIVSMFPPRTTQNGRPLRPYFTKLCRHWCAC